MLLSIVFCVLFVMISLAFIHFFTKKFLGVNTVSAVDFNNTALAICAIVTIAWGVFTYGALNQRDLALSQLKEINNKIRNTETTFFDIKTNIIKGDGFYYINPIVRVRNSGSDIIYIRLDPDSLSVTRVIAKGDKIIPFESYHPKLYSQVNTSGNAPINNMIVPIGAERSLGYLISVDTPGMYYVTFTATEMDSNGKVVHKEFDGTPMKWFSSSYIHVD